jgi:hypothetical protein
LPRRSVGIATMNIFWPSPASAVAPVFTRAIFCPSCHQKRGAKFGEWLCAHVLRKVPTGISSSASRRSCGDIFSMSGIFITLSLLKDFAYRATICNMKKLHISPPNRNHRKKRGNRLLF